MIVATRTAPFVDAASLRSQFTQLASELSYSDARLEDNQREGRHPTNGWDTTLRSYADRLDAARLQFADVTRGSGTDGIVFELGADSRDISELAGKTYLMQKSGSSFYSGWDTALDKSIADVQNAAAMLDSVPGPVPNPPQPPVPGTPSQLGTDAARAADLVRQSIDRIRTVPTDDRGSDSTKQARIDAYHLNLQAQEVLQGHFQGEDAAVTSQLRTADAHLEDANWQLAKKPSPDGRFNGVDIPGALRDSQAAVDLLDQLAHA
jgi:hypothetical protein